MACTILGNRKLGHAGEREEKDALFGFDPQGDSPVLKEVHSFDSFLSASEMPAKLGSFESEVRLSCEQRSLYGAAVLQKIKNAFWCVAMMAAHFVSV